MNPEEEQRPKVTVTNIEPSSGSWIAGGAFVALVLALGLMFWPSDTPPETKVQRDTAPTQNVVPPANKPVTTPGTPPPQ
jgi:hypothetical protein